MALISILLLIEYVPLFFGILTFGGSKIVVFRSHLKKVFSADIGVEPSSQVLDILEYACGLILGLALISTENPNFEIASK
jgi:hypothetical protein